MAVKKMDRTTRNKISYITFIVEKFASAYKMNRQESYFYLKKYGGMDYLFNHWQSLHSDNPFWVVREMYDVCRRNEKQQS
jgi:hypothetical protein